MIIWLASYPKSGNTWIRIFLNNLFYSNEDPSNINSLKIGQFPNRSHFSGLTDNLDDIKEFSENCINAQERLNLSTQFKFFKTHHAYWKSGKHTFTNNTNSLGVIYVVRDPRNIITSIKNHYDFIDYNDALNFLLNDKNVIGLRHSSNEVDLPHIISSWKNHYNSWKKMEKNYLLIKYENLLENPLIEFKKITNYLEKIIDKKFEERKFFESIDNCNFIKLKDQENKLGFIEAQKDKFGKVKPFFNLGPNNNWKKLLDKNIAKVLENEFYKEMSELNYI